MIKTLLIALFSWCIIVCWAQKPPMVVSRMTETGVQLKWFPEDLIQRKGISVMRKHEDGEWISLNDAPIIPWKKPYNGISNLPPSVKNTVQQLSEENPVSKKDKEELFSAISEHQGLADYMGLYFEDRTAVGMVDLSYRIMDVDGGLIGQIEPNSDIWEGTLEAVRFWRYEQADKQMRFIWKPESNRFHRIEVFASYNGGPAQSIRSNIEATKNHKGETEIQSEYTMKQDGYYEFYLQGAGYFGQYSIPTKHIVIISGADADLGNGLNQDISLSSDNSRPSHQETGILPSEVPELQPEWNGVAKSKRDNGLLLIRYAVSGRKVVLYWEITQGGWSNLEILRSTNYLNGFEKISGAQLEGTEGKFEDTLTNLGDHFYVLKATDQEGLVHYSNKVVAHVGSSRGPGTPQNLEAKSDTGKVKLSWDPVDGDSVSYRVFRKPIDEDVFQPITFEPIYNNSYTDKHYSKQRTRFEYYVVAFDARKNGSLPSRHIKVELPDVVGPDRPQMKQVVKDGKYLQVVWNRSMAPDLSHYELYRKSNDTDFELIEGNQLSKGREQYLDTDVKYNNEYTYVLVSVDSAGNRSPRSGEASYKMADRFVVEQLGIQTKVKIKPRKGFAFISWKKRADAIGYEVYRVIGAVQRKLTATAIQENKFEVLLLEGKTTYVVKALTESELVYKSSPIVIEQ